VGVRFIGALSSRTLRHRLTSLESLSAPSRVCVRCTVALGARGRLVRRPASSTELAKGCAAGAPKRTRGPWHLAHMGHVCKMWHRPSFQTAIGQVRMDHMKPHHQGTLQIRLTLRGQPLGRNATLQHNRHRHTRTPCPNVPNGLIHADLTVPNNIWSALRCPAREDLVEGAGCRTSSPPCGF